MESPTPAGPSADLELMRASSLLETDPGAAMQRAGAILREAPGHEGALLLLATASRRLGDPARSREVLASLARAQPQSATLQLELGRACGAAGLPNDAAAAFQAAVALKPSLADAWNELAAERYRSGDTPGGDAAYARYRRLTPESPEVRDAVSALEENRIEPAEAALKRRLLAVPEDVTALRLLARIVRVRGNFLEATRLLAHCVQLAPGYAEARFELAAELSTQQRNAEALEQLERLLTTEPRNPDYLGLKAMALRQAGRNSEGLELMRQAIAEAPADFALQVNLGHMLRDAGDSAAAVEAYRRALAIRPGLGEAYRSLADLKTLRFTATDREAMQAQLARDVAPSADRAQLEFALGKAREDEGDYAAAYAHYASANSSFRQFLGRVPDVLSGGRARARVLYTKEFFAARAGWGSERDDPIFIVGLPRSGSTLLEQILASHSQVEGTRELPHVPAIARALMLATDPYGEATYPNPVGALTRDEIESLAARYLADTQPYRLLGRPHFVDKTLANFDHVGLIHLMFPRAAIIDIRRHPLACCFSMYRQFFGTGHPYSYDFAELGRHYRNYCALMQHLDTVLPGRVHRVHYEQLVAEPEAVVRRLLEHCGLPFEAGCLRFHDNRRSVSTLSSEQVRRPIYADAVGQWRHFEPWLGGLRAALGELVDEYPDFERGAR